MHDWKRQLVAVFVATLVAQDVDAARNDAAPGPSTPPVIDLERFRDCSECPEMVVLPAGGFIMGSEDGKQRERPPHRVTFEKPFAIGVREVTVGEWRACVVDGGCRALTVSFCYPEDDPSPDDSACGIGWLDAQDYVAWLNRRTGQRYRLPSEAEWEYAARGGTTTAYWWGDAYVPGLANGDLGGEPSGWLAVAGTFPPNPFGLFDMAGNLSEWTEDCWNTAYIGAPTDGSAWLTGDCKRRVIRGGDRQSPPEVLRSAYRWGINGNRGRGNSTGMRVVRDM